MAGEKLKVGVIGASGYTGADMVRLAVRHPDIEIAVVTANSHAGKPIAQVFPHLAGLGLPDLIKNDQADWSRLDAVFCGLPHSTSQDVIVGLPDHLKIIDMSADFRLRDGDVYRQWYGVERADHGLAAGAVYGLTEHNRDDIANARLVACPGCYPTAVLTALLPLVSAGLIDPADLIIDAKSGLSGAGRGLKQSLLFCEAGEGVSPYAVAGHRHAPEIEQEISKAAGVDVIVNFTPHLVPVSRGELTTSYVRLCHGKTAADCHAALAEAYDKEPFVSLAPEGVMPATQHVRGSNNVMLACFADRVPGRAIIVSVLDNLVKGSAGQALQNFNVMFGIEETAGLTQVAMFP